MATRRFYNILMQDFGVQSVRAEATDQLVQKVKTTRLPTRAQQLSALRTKTFDVLVIGGGVTGCGVALDAVSRGTTLIAPTYRPRLYHDRNDVEG